MVVIPRKFFSSVNEVGRYSNPDCVCATMLLYIIARSCLLLCR